MSLLFDINIIGFTATPMFFGFVCLLKKKGCQVLLFCYVHRVKKKKIKHREWTDSLGDE